MSPQTTMPKPNHQNKQSQNKEGELKGQIEKLVGSEKLEAGY